MWGSRSTRGIALAGTALAAVFAAAPVTTAFADEDTPPPLVCQGDLFTDPAGDAVDSTPQVIRLNGLPEPVGSLGTLPGQDNEDILGATISSTDGAVAVAIKLKDMSKTVPSDATGIAWYFGYQVNGADPVWVGAETDGTSYTFSQGTITDTQGSVLYQTSGASSGAVTEGPNGTITLDLPGAGSGDEITGTWAESDQEVGASVAGNGFSSLPRSDTAPDAGGYNATNAGDFTVDGCGTPADS